MAKTFHYSVFFNDTLQRTSDDSLANLFYKHVDLNPEQKSEIFGGGGGFLGKAINQNCQHVVKQLDTLLKSNDEVVLTVYGAGQGGITAIMLAMACSKIPPETREKLKINLALLDPQPGNFISTAFIDPFKISLANKVADLRKCAPLKRVMALYTSEPQMAIVARAPISPLYPKNEDLSIRTDVIAGSLKNCDQGSLASPESFVAFARFYTFLKECGTQFKAFSNLQTFDMNLQKTDEFNYQPPNNRIDFDELTPRFVAAYQQMNKNKKPAIRACHSITGVAIKTCAGEVDYFNRHHQQLVDGTKENASTRVSIESTHNMLASFNRFTTSYPRLWRAIKWSLFVLACAAVATFLVMTPTTTALGLILASVAGAAIGSSALLLWHIKIKPAIKNRINALFYTEFQEAECLASSNSYGKMAELSRDVLPIQSEGTEQLQTGSLWTEKTPEIVESHSANLSLFLKGKP